MKMPAAILLLLLASAALGCACGVERHPHEHVIDEIRDDDLLLDDLYCPDLDLVGIGSAPWFHGRECAR